MRAWTLSGGVGTLAAKVASVVSSCDSARPMTLISGTMRGEAPLVSTPTGEGAVASLLGTTLWDFRVLNAWIVKKNVALSAGPVKKACNLAATKSKP